MASLLYKVFCPFAGDPDFAGICGAVCISSGLLATAIISPVIARCKASLISLRIFIPIIGLCYLAFIWIPDTQSQTEMLIIIAILGAATFSLIPTTLEYLVDSLHPIAPENTSSLCWAAGQLLGVVFISTMEVLNAGDNSDVPIHLKR
jgi:MFS transporter, FLVCR family, MFS-domain-containing protein 7